MTLIPGPARRGRVYQCVLYYCRLSSLVYKRPAYFAGHPVRKQWSKLLQPSSILLQAVQCARNGEWSKQRSVLVQVMWYINRQRIIAAHPVYKQSAYVAGHPVCKQWSILVQVVQYINHQRIIAAHPVYKRSAYFAGHPVCKECSVLLQVIRSFQHTIAEVYKQPPYFCGPSGAEAMERTIGHLAY